MVSFSTCKCDKGSSRSTEALLMLGMQCLAVLHACLGARDCADGGGGGTAHNSQTPQLKAHVHPDALFYV
jgi:hypothetical protein